MSPQCIELLLAGCGKLSALRISAELRGGSLDNCTNQGVGRAHFGYARLIAGED